MFEKVMYFLPYGYKIRLLEEQVKNYEIDIENHKRHARVLSAENERLLKNQEANTLYKIEELIDTFTTKIEEGQNVKRRNNRAKNGNSKRVNRKVR